MSIREKEEVKVITTNGSQTEKEPVAASSSPRPDLVKEVHLRIPLHIAVPIGALIFIAIAALLFGLFLLKLPKEHAPAVALALGINILAATTFAASRRKLGFATVVELCALVIYPVLLAVVLVNVGGFEAAGAAEEHSATGGAAAEAAAPIELSASDLEFSTDEMTFPADEEVVLAFDNPDSAPHNVSIYADDTLNEEFFIGSNVEPGASTEYEVPALEAGPYYFQCDLHPTMNGRVIVE